jgi:hypothetical protein
MNCKRVEELLPLYVGNDLEEERAMLVTSHVRSCSQCARSAREYRETNQLLQRFEPPQFNEATYLAIRNSVLREVERQSNATTLLRFIARPFQPRMMWAVSTAVLLAVCLFAYYFIAHRTRGPLNEQQLTENRGGGEQNTRDQKTNAGPQRTDPTGTAGVPPASATRSPKSGLNLVTHNKTADVPPALASSSRKPRLNLTAQTVWHSRRAGETPAVPVKSAQYSPVGPTSPTGDSSVTSDKTLRLEIQTSDPNIRIIWFSHPSNNEGSPNESSKGI